MGVKVGRLSAPGLPSATPQHTTSLHLRQKEFFIQWDYSNMITKQATFKELQCQVNKHRIKAGHIRFDSIMHVGSAEALAVQVCSHRIFSNGFPHSTPFM